MKRLREFFDDLAAAFGRRRTSVPAPPPADPILVGRKSQVIYNRLGSKLIADISPRGIFIKVDPRGGIAGLYITKEELKRFAEVCARTEPTTFEPGGQP